MAGVNVSFDVIEELIQSLQKVKGILDSVVDKIVDSPLRDYRKKEVDMKLDKIRDYIVEASDTIDSIYTRLTVMHLAIHEYVGVSGRYLENGFSSYDDSIPPSENTSCGNGNAFSNLLSDLEASHAVKIPYDMHVIQPTSDEIISEIGGWDLTKGSCSSVALAYIANRHGMNVHDFRGGRSRAFFARPSNIEKMAEMAGGRIVHNSNDFSALIELMPTLEPDKEYYLAIGSHAAVVRQTDSRGYEYLELQSGHNCGFMPLSANVFKSRFGCSSKSNIGMAVLIPADQIASSESFGTMMQYINTPIGGQRRGIHGRTR